VVAVLLWLLACAPSDPDMGPVDLRPVVPQADTGQPDNPDGCVENVDLDRRHLRLQEAFDAAREGDTLRLCDSALSEGGETELSLSLEGGLVLGTVTVGGGTINGLSAEALVLGPEPTTLREVSSPQVRAIGTIVADELDATELIVEAGGVLSGVDVGVLELSGGTTITASELGTVVALDAVVDLEAVSLSSLTQTGGVVVAASLAPSGPLSVSGGRLEVGDSDWSDAGAVAITVQEGELVLSGVSLGDTVPDDDNVAIVLQASSAELEAVELVGFSAGVLQASDSDLIVDGLSGLGGLLLSGGSLSATAIDLDQLDLLDAPDVELADSTLVALRQEGGTLAVTDGTFGGDVGVGVDLVDVAAALTRVVVTDVDGETVVTELADGGWTQSEDGGVGIQLVGGSLVVDGLELHDLPYGLRAEDAVVSGSDLLCWWTWQAAVTLSGGSIDLSQLWVSGGRGWGLVATDAEVVLDEPVFADMDLLRRTTSVYDSEGSWESEALTLSQVPALQAEDSDVSFTDGELIDLSGVGIAWRGDDEVLSVARVSMDEVDLQGLALIFEGADAQVSLVELSLSELRADAIDAVGDGRGSMRLEDVLISGSEQTGVSVSGLQYLEVVDLEITDTAEEGVYLTGVSQLLFQDFSLSELGGAGLRLSDVAGTIEEGEISRAEGPGLSVAAGAVGLSAVVFRESAVALSCNDEDDLDPCGDLGFIDIDHPSMGCSESCLE